MSTLVFSLKEPPRQRVDLSPLTPDRLRGKTLKEVRAVDLQCGNQALKAGALFEIQGSDANDILLRDASEKFDRIGAAMTQGKLTVQGDCGAYLGLGMAGGEILVRGNAGAFAASGMKNGVLRIQGDAGDFLGGALAGERRGMLGGTVLVAGNAGDRIGDFMRRGMILVEGSAGDYCGSRLLAGTVAVLGAIGEHAGYAMRHGTILLARAPERFPVTFNDCGEHALGFLVLLIKSWRKLGGRFAELKIGGNRVHRYAGDLANGGKGEILIWRAAAD